jgi:hypothetical protein
VPEFHPVYTQIVDPGGYQGGSPYRFEVSRAEPGQRPAVPPPPRPPSPDDSGGFEVPHVSTFAYRYNTHARAYWGWYDESQKWDLRTANAMRRDGYVQELLRHRQLPTAFLKHTLDPDDPEDEHQVKVCNALDKIIEAIPRFMLMKMWLLEAVHFGKSAVQVKYGRKSILGKERVTVTGFVPVHGDKIRYKWDGTPGVLVRVDDLIKDEYRGDVTPLDVGQVLWMHKRHLRDRYVIHEFEPSDAEYLYEGDKAMAVHGLGLRDRLFWTWNMRAELLGWYVDAMQRVGANGMLFGFYQSGNVGARARMLQALSDLVTNNIAVFATEVNASNLKDMIQRIEPNAVGYDNLFRLIAYLDSIMRRAYLGQDLSSQAMTTGLGSKVAELQEDMFQGIIRYDSMMLAETLEDQLIKPLLKFNEFTYRGKLYRGDRLPFGIRYRFKVDEKNALERLQMAMMLAQLGVQLDADELRDICQFRAPKNVQSAVPPQQQPATPAGPGGGPEGGEPGGGGPAPSAGGGLPPGATVEQKPQQNGRPQRNGQPQPMAA